jgi:hypothetical protein
LPAVARALLITLPAVAQELLFTMSAECFCLHFWLLRVMPNFFRTFFQKKFKKNSDFFSNYLPIK